MEMILNLSCVEDFNFEPLRSPEIFLMSVMVARMFTAFIKSTSLTQRTCHWPGHLNGVLQDFSQSLNFEFQKKEHVEAFSGKWRRGFSLAYQISEYHAVNTSCHAGLLSTSCHQHISLPVSKWVITASSCISLKN